MRTRTTWILIVSAFVAAALPSRQAEARPCTVASDCPKGFDCEPTDVPPDAGPAGLCVSLPCQSNSDCGPGLTCYLEGYGLSLPAEVATVCAQADGGTCGACVPQWHAPCVTASDCGPGYTCPVDTFTGSVSCGKDQQPDASEPPYATLTVIPCSAVPEPPFLPPADSGFPAVPAICDAGSTCTKVSWNSCVAQQNGPCSADSDCPSTWTCACPMTFGGGPTAPPGTPVVDAGCTMTCIPPNSDLLEEVPDNGFGGGASGPGASTAPSSTASDGAVDPAASGESPVAPGSSGGHGGCQIGSDGARTSWPLVAMGALAWARRRRRLTR